LVLSLCYLDIPKLRSFDSNFKIKSAQIPDRVPSKRHLPAVEIAIDGYRRYDQIVLNEIVTSCEADLPVLGQIESEVELKVHILIYDQRSLFRYSDIEADGEVPRYAQVRTLCQLVKELYCFSALNESSSCWGSCPDVRWERFP